MKRNMFKLFAIAGLAAASFLQAMDQEPKPNTSNIKIEGANINADNLNVDPNSTVSITTEGSGSSANVSGLTADSESTVNVKAQQGGSVSMENATIGKGAKVIIATGVSQEEMDKIANEMLRDFWK